MSIVLSITFLQGSRCEELLPTSGSITRPKRPQTSTELWGQKFVALNGGPHFAFSPAVSFFASFGSVEEMDSAWKALSAGGQVLMELGRYPFSERFGWLQDRFGVSWQLNIGNGRKRISPFLMSVEKHHGKAEQAIDFYLTLFENSRILTLERYGAGDGEPEGTLKRASFSLDGAEFMAIDSKGEHAFTITPAISFEVDRLWESLSRGGEEQKCGWVTDKFGVTWQIVPTILGELLGDKDPKKSERVMKAMLQMVKLDIETLKKAYEG
jgi:predicted 3-demethylubiquinone-9 3-methyltransferase (glyoxalase superfamily)